MQPVVLMILFFIHGQTVGAQLVGSAKDTPACQALAAQVLDAHKGQEPTDNNGVKATPFPLCIDTTEVAAAVEGANKAIEAAKKHGLSTSL